MSRVGIVTDSVSCLPAEVIKEYGIRVVPVGLSINGKAYRDQVDITPDEFWKMFPEIKELTTGTGPLGDYIEAFQGLAQSTDSIFCTFVSKGLSAIPEAAVQARERFKAENPNVTIEIIDSRTCLGAQGFIPFIEVARRDASTCWKEFHDWPASYARYVQYIFCRYQANQVILSPIHFDSGHQSVHPKEYSDITNDLLDKECPPLARCCRAIPVGRA